MLAAALLVVGGLRVWAVCRQAPRSERKASEIGSTRTFKVALHPNYGGSALLFFQETETGIGTYFCETATGKTRLLYEEKEDGYRNRFRHFGWSPEDKVLAFTIFSEAEGTNLTRTITLCDGLTGEVLSQVPAGGVTGDSQFIWLSTRSFVFSTANHRSWLMYEQQADGKWAQTQVVKRFAEGRLANVTPISGTALAWQDKGKVWTYDFATGMKEQVWEAKTNTLSGLGFSAVSGNLLLRCTDKKGAYEAEYHLPRLGETNGSIVRITRPPPAGAALGVTMKEGKFKIKFRPASEKKDTIFTWEGMLFSYNGVLQYRGIAKERLFFVGSAKDGLPEVWEYNAQSQKLRQVTSTQQPPFKWAKVVEPVIGFYTNKAGEEASYHLWPPVSQVPGKKYPVVITSELHDWGAFQQAAPNAGCFFAHLDRPDEIVQDWAEHVEGVYRALAKNIEIDTNRVFFIASSGQDVSLPMLADAKLGIDFRLILYHPVVGSQSMQNLTGKRMVMFGGADDKMISVAAMSKLNDEAFNNGNCMDLYFEDGQQHITRSAGTQRRETIRFARFLDQNK